MEAGDHSQPRVGRVFCFGFRPWKKAYVRQYLASAAEEVVFVHFAREAQLRGFDRDARIVVWGSGEGPEVQKLVRRFGAAIWRMEDGFLRSVGLGSDRYSPLSLVLDREGIYYDPTHPSQLETELSQRDFADDLARARK